MEERWLPVPGFEGLFEVSDRGRIRSLKTSSRWKPGYILKARPNNHGYVVAGLRKDSKRTNFVVHRLVLEMFLGPCPPGCVANHKNLDKSDNRIENLEWVTQAENVQHAIDNGHFSFMPMGEANHASKLTANQVREIRCKFAETHCAHQVLADKYGVTRNTVCKIVRRESWKHIT